MASAPTVDDVPSTEIIKESAVAAVEQSAAYEIRIQQLRKHFETKGYRVHSGLQFGCELVLYADDPSRVHSDFCVHLVAADGSIDWRAIQSLVRSMSDFHKTLIVAHLREDGSVDEMAFTTEHAPFRHRRSITAVGDQRKSKHTKLEHNSM